MTNLFDLKGKNAYVTCAAKGIGKEYAVALAQAGANVAVVDACFEDALQTTREIEQYGGRAMAIGADVCDEAEAAEMTAQVKAALGSIDIAVNHMDDSPISKSIMKTSLEEWNCMMKINLTSVYIAAKAAGMAMMKQGSGVIITSSSLAAYIVSEKSRAAYSAAKSGVLHLTRSLAAEWAPYHIRVNSVSHGYLVCEMRDCDETTHLLKRTPMQRMGNPEELRGTLIYLASDASTYTTGIDILVDGGFHFW